MEVTGKFKTSLPRQITEGVQIHNFPGRLINRRSEWRMPGVARTEVSRKVKAREELGDRTDDKFAAIFMLYM